MSNITESLAKQTVDAFRAELDEQQIEQLGHAQLDRLELLIGEAVAAALHHAAEQVDNLADSLRAEGEAGALELEL